MSNPEASAAASLAEAQRGLSRWITAPEGAGAVLAGGARREAEALIRGDCGLDAEARLGVYANAFFARIHGALANDYPALAAELGEGAFHDLVKVYLLAHPSRSFTLRDVGGSLADYLAEGPLADTFRRRCAHAADLARFEWALVEAFDAADAPALERDALAAVPSARWAELRFALAPSLRLLSLSHPVHERLPAADAGAGAGAPGPLSARPTHYRVWRRDESVRWKEIDAGERALLEAARAGVPFGALCERLAEDGPEDDAAPRAVALLERWIAAGLLAGLDA